MDIRSEIVGFLTTISLLLQWLLSFLKDPDRILTALIEDAVIDQYFEDRHLIANSYHWLCIRSLILETFRILGEEHISLSTLFNGLRRQIKISLSTDFEKQSLLKIVNSLELKILREFRLCGIEEQQLHLKPIYFFNAISYVLSTQRG